jgi:UDP-4-amino-4,6-dideoxy-N-acetyl-beta-L-altrosamine N-acetyltransferase
MEMWRGLLVLRDLVPQDSDRLLAWRNSPHVVEHMYTDHPIGVEEHTRWFTAIANDRRRKYWISVWNGQDVGLVNLYDIDVQNLRCHWAFYLGETAVIGRGIGGFIEYALMHHVFDERKYEKLCCEVLASNRTVLDLHRQFGFEQEGYFREHIRKQGRACDVVALAILRERWEHLRPELYTRLARIADFLSRCKT